MQFSKEPSSLNTSRKGNAGFTLIELAIVLIVIGFILTAVVKSNSLITDASILNFSANPVHQLQADAMTYYSKTGQFPGYTLVGNSVEGALWEMWNLGMKDVAQLNIPFVTTGGTSSSDLLCVAMGNIPVQNSDNTVSNYPVMLIFPVNLSAYTGISVSNWTPNTLNYVTRLKTIIDGNQNPLGASYNNNNWGSVGALRFYGGGLGFSFQFNSFLAVNGHSSSTIPYDVFFSSSPTFNSYYFNQSPSFALGKSGSSCPLFYFYYQQPY